MKPLQQQFDGVGEVKGYSFKQLVKSEYAYLYSKTNEFNDTHYEVFKHKENTRFCTTTYPSSKSFGIWAWSYPTYKQALQKYKLLNQKAKKQKNESNNKSRVRF